MQFHETSLSGLHVIELDFLTDDRGYFARTFCASEFASHGLDPNVAQCNVSFNRRRGTLRGLHYQQEPHSEAKLVTCVSGEVVDIAVDLRPESPTRCQWFAVHLDSRSRRAVFIPKGFAHGFQTLTDDACLLYQMSVSHHPEAARGIRWNDPIIGVHWPIPDPIVSPKDAALPLLSPLSR